MALGPGGISLAFVPTALQVYPLVNELRDTRSFRLGDTQEVRARSWRVSRQSLRPDPLTKPPLPATILW